MLHFLLPLLAARQAEQVLHTYQPRTWYADLLAGPAEVSPDGGWLLYTLEGRPELVELASGEVRSLAERMGLDEVAWARWAGSGARLVAVGRKDGKVSAASFDPSSGEQGESGLWDAFDDVLFTSRPGRRIVAGRREEIDALWLEDTELGEPRALVSGSFHLGWAVSPEATELVFLRQNEAGWVDLEHVELDSGTRRVLRTNLDASYQPTPLAWWKGEVLLSLVGATEGTSAAKQDPTAERDLDLFALSLADGSLRCVVEAPGDDLVTGVAGGRLLWTNVHTSMRVARVPSAGGELVELAGATASFPSWHPDGERVALMYGPMTLADWALNWDLGSVPLDAELRPSGALEPLIVGPHEDFGPSFSPDGRWLAYHSHRSPAPSMAYRGWKSTDDIWLRPANGGKELRLTHEAGFEVCQPDWSPDGCELIFVAVDPRTGRCRPVVVEIDPETGATLDQREFHVPGIDGDVLAAVYSPGEPEVALEERTRAGRRRLWVVEIETRKARLLAEFEALTEVSGLDFDPLGESVYYVALAGGHHQLFRVRADGSSQSERLTDVREELLTPQVSPEGEQVALTIYTHTKTVRSRPLESMELERTAPRGTSSR